ncbi:MAG: toll/interleukin-1 receptor domain-containing protein [Acidobacteria bacterium]|nr:toll/interleukin-1 receptor domain-containing protein [Acidobacteriota bacterium]
MKVFISYGRKDAAEFAMSMAEWLRNRGHTPWIDIKQGVPVGAAFDIRIELGIENSDLMVALLSPWSLRPESFCRNELLYAQAMKRPIVPIRLAELVPPIQILPLSWLDAFPDSNTAFEKLPSIIEEVVRTGEMPRRIWTGIESAGAGWIKEEKLDFGEEMRRYGSSFTGRDWLFAEMTLDALCSSDPECRMSVNEIGALPPNLGGLYHSMFRRRFAGGQRYHHEILPVPECLVSAASPNFSMRLGKESTSLSSRMNYRARGQEFEGDMLDELAGGEMLNSVFL